MRWIIPCLFLAGCGAEMVSAPGRSGLAYGPANEAQRPGVIKYLAGGAWGQEQRNRQDAYAQMYRACGGRYKIDAEGAQGQGGVLLPAAGSMVYAEQTYWVIRFSCLPAGDQRRASVAAAR